MGGLAPRSACPGGELHSSPGRSLIWLTAKSTLYRKGTRFQRLPPTIRFPPAAPWRHSGAPFFPPESCQGFPTDALGQFWRTETGQFWSAPKSFARANTRKSVPLVSSGSNASPITALASSLRRASSRNVRRALSKSPSHRLVVAIGSNSFVKAVQSPLSRRVIQLAMVLSNDWRPQPFPCNSSSLSR